MYSQENYDMVINKMNELTNGSSNTYLTIEQLIESLSDISGEEINNILLDLEKRLIIKVANRISYLGETVIKRFNII
ncbi:MAG: hypothetical protein LBJ31_07655 [Treponema sp.]|nr:hypothetical protein [Treponema sp.]